MNYDGAVDSTDFGMFFDAFANAQPAADLNLDNQVDVTDAEVFLNSFANENP